MSALGGCEIGRQSTVLVREERGENGNGIRIRSGLGVKYGVLIPWLPGRLEWQRVYPIHLSIRKKTVLPRVINGGIITVSLCLEIYCTSVRKPLLMTGVRRKSL
jgi:hypothetical protein